MPELANHEIVDIHTPTYLTSDPENKLPQNDITLHFTERAKENTNPLALGIAFANALHANDRGSLKQKTLVAVLTLDKHAPISPTVDCTPFILGTFSENEGYVVTQRAGQIFEIDLK